MLRFDPFTDVDALTRSLMSNAVGTSRVPQFMPMDLYRVDDHYVLHADLPGVDPGSVDVDVENGTLTLTAHRSAPSAEHVQWLASEGSPEPIVGSCHSATASTPRTSLLPTRTVS